MDINKKYYRYQLTFPFESNKIYRSKSLKKVITKCYHDYKKFSDIDEGLFCITNLDKDIEYKFIMKNKKIEKINNKQFGGKINHNQNTELRDLFEDIDLAKIKNNETYCIIL